MHGRTLTTQLNTVTMSFHENIATSIVDKTCMDDYWTDVFQVHLQKFIKCTLISIIMELNTLGISVELHLIQYHLYLFEFAFVIEKGNEIAATSHQPSKS